MHLDVAQLCHDYLASTDEAIRSGSFGSEKGIAIRAGQERVRALHRHHLLTWARGQSQALTHEAQQRARTFDKIETATRAIDCIDSALRVYPDETELNESRVAIGEFIASVKVAHWVELAERSAFKGHYRRAIDRYRDALFYLNQDVVKEEVRIAGTEKIEREIAKLRARLRPNNGAHQQTAEGRFGRAKSGRMIVQKCPKCGSSRIRRGYKRTPLPMRSGWHLPPFVRSLQLAFHGFCGALDLAPSEKTPAP